MSHRLRLVPEAISFVPSGVHTDSADIKTPDEIVGGFDANRPVSRVLLKTAIYLDPPLPAGSSHLLGTAGPAMCPSTVLLRIEFTAERCPQRPGGLLPPPFHPYRRYQRRYISVALVLKLPSAGVTRYPCPVEPGLSSRTAFRLMPAAVQPARRIILTR